MSKIISDVSPAAIYRKWCVSAATSEARRRKREPKVTKGDGERGQDEIENIRNDEWNLRIDVAKTCQAMSRLSNSCRDCFWMHFRRRRREQGREVRQGPRYLEISSIVPKIYYTGGTDVCCWRRRIERGREKRNAWSGNWHNFGRNNLSRARHTT